KLVNAGVVDEDVDPPERLLRLGEESADVPLLRQVGADGHGLAAVARDLGNHTVGPLLARRVVHDDGRSLRGQMFRDVGPDPLGRPGDHRDLAFQFAGHDRLLYGKLCTEGYNTRGGGLTRLPGFFLVEGFAWGVRGNLTSTRPWTGHWTSFGG